MFESNSKFPRFFVYMMSMLALLSFVAIFFSSKLVLAIYFVALILCIVLLILDRKYATILTNYKLTYLLFDILNLVAIISVIYYEYAVRSKLLDAFLILLSMIEIVLIVVDIFVIKNKNLTKNENLIIDFTKLCSMISFLTYFFNVSTLYFSIFAFAFELVNLCSKVVFNLTLKKIEKKEVKVEPVEDIIHSESKDEGDGD